MDSGRNSSSRGSSSSSSIDSIISSSGSSNGIDISCNMDRDSPGARFAT